MQMAVAVDTPYNLAHILVLANRVDDTDRPYNYHLAELDSNLAYILVVVEVHMVVVVDSD